MRCLAASAALMAIACLFASGCASSAVVRATPEKIALAGAEADVSRLAEALLAAESGARLDGEASVVSLCGSWNGNPFSAECVLKRSGDSLVAVFLAPQMRLATLKIRPPHAIEWEAAPRIPSAFRPEYAIFDLAFARLPAKALRDALGGEFLFSEHGGTLRVSAGGKDIAERRELPDGGVKVENFFWKYEYSAREMR